MKKELRQKIRKGYRDKFEYIQKTYPNFCPYDLLDVDWLNVMTPIEYNVWCDIRNLGCEIKCPQYPIGKYFVDFADPVKKIAIEVDGHKWHLDKDKDNERQNEIESKGWTIYRIEGWQTCKLIEDIDFDDDIDENYREEMYYKKNKDCSEYIIRKIMQRHYFYSEKRLNCFILNAKI